MRKHWIRYVVVFGFAAASGAALLHTSQDVQQAEDHLRTVRSAVDSERESIRLLEAEWGYLNSPQRLEVLAAQYLDLVPPVPGTTLATPAGLPDPFIPALPAHKPDITAQPAVLTAQDPPAPQAAQPAVPSPVSSPISSSIIKPKAKPVLKTPQPPPTTEKSFDDLLTQLQDGGAQ